MFEDEMVLVGMLVVATVVVFSMFDINTKKVDETKAKGNYEIRKQLVFSDTKKLIVELNNLMETDSEIDKNHKIVKQINYENNEYIYLKGNEEKIEDICKSVVLSFEDCNLIKWKNTKNSEKVKELLKNKIKVIEIN